MNRAIFLDRDGVLIDDVDLLTRRCDVRIKEGVPESLTQLKEAGFRLIVVSNQTVVARGLASEEEVRALEAEIEYLLVAAGAPRLAGFYFCPHHPNATLPAFRVRCACRKPSPGLLLQAGRELAIDISASVLVGDRLTDIVAGARAGCRTVLVTTGMHDAPVIETAEPFDQSITPQHVCGSLSESVAWILGERRA